MFSIGVIQSAFFLFFYIATRTEFSWAMCRSRERCIEGKVKCFLVFIILMRV